VVLAATVALLPMEVGLLLELRWGTPGYLVGAVLGVLALVSGFDLFDKVETLREGPSHAPPPRCHEGRCGPRQFVRRYGTALGDVHTHFACDCGHRYVRSSRGFLHAPRGGAPRQPYLRWLAWRGWVRDAAFGQPLPPDP